MTTLATTVPSAASADAERFQTAGVVTVTGGHAVNDTYTSFLPPLLPSLIQSFGLSNTQAGLLSVFLPGGHPYCNRSSVTWPTARTCATW